MTKVAASILSADFANLHKDCTRLLEAGADVMHFDVMDGHFVPNISYGAPVLTCLHAALPDVFYDVHPDDQRPGPLCRGFCQRPAPISSPSILRPYPTRWEEVIAAIRATGCQVGISIRPGTPWRPSFRISALWI